MLEGHVSWATWGFLLTTLGWLARHAGQQSIPQFDHLLQRTARNDNAFPAVLISLVISILLSVLLFPNPFQFGCACHKLVHAAEWLAMPFVMVFLSALPALDGANPFDAGKTYGILG